METPPRRRAAALRWRSRRGRLSRARAPRPPRTRRRRSPSIQRPRTISFFIDRRLPERLAAVARRGARAASRTAAAPTSSRTSKTIAGRRLDRNVAALGHTAASYLVARPLLRRARHARPADSDRPSPGPTPAAAPSTSAGTSFSRSSGWNVGYTAEHPHPRDAPHARPRRDAAGPARDHGAGGRALRELTGSGTASVGRRSAAFLRPRAGRRRAARRRGIGAGATTSPSVNSSPSWRRVGPVTAPGPAGTCRSCFRDPPGWRRPRHEDPRVAPRDGFVVDPDDGRVVPADEVLARQRARSARRPQIEAMLGARRDAAAAARGSRSTAPPRRTRSRNGARSARSGGRGRRRRARNAARRRGWRGSSRRRTCRARAPRGSRPWRGPSGA